jgi:hypothetical protein
VLENRVLRRMFASKGEEIIGRERENCLVKNVIICSLHQTLLE